MAARYARERQIPYLGLCLGLQVMVVEFCRHVLCSEEPNSTEFRAEDGLPRDRPAAGTAGHGCQGRDHAAGQLSVSGCCRQPRGGAMLNRSCTKGIATDLSLTTTSAILWSRQDSLPPACPRR